MKRKLESFSRREIYGIAKDYATTTCEVSAEHYCEVYQISASTFYNLIGKAIREHIVSEQIAGMIAEKSASNSERHGGGGGKYRSHSRYVRLMEQRRAFNFSRKEKKRYAVEYANSDDTIDMRAFAREKYMSVGLLQRTLVSAVVDNIVSDEVVEQLYQKALRHNPEESVNRFFNSLRVRRQGNKLAQKARKKQRCKHTKGQEETEVQAHTLDDFKQISPEEEWEQLKFIQNALSDFGIPDEMPEMASAIDEVKITIELAEEDDSEAEGVQLSFFDNS